VWKPPITGAILATGVVATGPAPATCPPARPRAAAFRQAVITAMTLMEAATIFVDPTIRADRWGPFDVAYLTGGPRTHPTAGRRPTRTTTSRCFMLAELAFAIPLVAAVAGLGGRDARCRLGVPGPPRSRWLPSASRRHEQGLRQGTGPPRGRRGPRGRSAAFAGVPTFRLRLPGGQGQARHRSCAGGPGAGHHGSGRSRRAGPGPAARPTQHSRRLAGT